MSYEPTTWVNGVTPVNSTNMNKIEQGIRQNSEVNAQQSLEITKLLLELDLQKLSGVGFYDMFLDTSDVDLPKTTATVSTGSNNVTFPTSVTFGAISDGAFNTTPNITVFAEKKILAGDTITIGVTSYTIVTATEV